MMKSVSPLLAVGAVACSMLFSSCATYPYQANTKSGTVIGGLLGAAAGAAIGENKGRELEGAAIGAALGAIAGGTIGSAEDEAYARSAAAQQGTYIPQAPPATTSYYSSGYPTASLPTRGHTVYSGYPSHTTVYVGSGYGYSSNSYRPSYYSGYNNRNYCPPPAPVRHVPTSVHRHSSHSTRTPVRASPPSRPPSTRPSGTPSRVSFKPHSSMRR